MQTNGNERETDRASLADANLAAQFGYVKDKYVQEVPRPNHVVVGHHAQGGGKLTNAVIHLLWSLESWLRLRPSGRRKSEQPEQCPKDKIPSPRIQSRWLHKDRKPPSDYTAEALKSMRDFKIPWLGQAAAAGGACRMWLNEPLEKKVEGSKECES